MDILATNSNRIFYRLDDGICHLLLTAFPESFKQVNTLAPARDLSGINGNVAVPKPKGEPQWSLASAYMDPQRIVGLRILLPSGEQLTVDGPANQIKARAEKILAGRKAPLPSDELIAQYAAATGGKQ